MYHIKNSVKSLDPAYEWSLWRLNVCVLMACIIRALVPRVQGSISFLGKSRHTLSRNNVVLFTADTGEEFHFWFYDSNS